MNRLENYSKRLMLCLVALLLPALMVGCGNWKGDGNKGNKAITAFSLAGVPGTIDEISKNIAVTVPFDTDVTTLTATYTTTGTGVKVGTAPQTSGATPNNFTTPVTYTVTAADATTADYSVIVTVASISAKAITSFSFVGYPGATGIINEVASPKTIAVTVPFGTNLNNLAATLTTTGIGVKVGTTPQTSGITPNNFTAPVTYTVMAADATTADYSVIVTVAPISAKAITSFSFVGYPGATGIINEVASPKTIAVTVPFGTNLNGLAATFTTTGTGVKVSATPQTSGITPNNFTTPVTYTVTAIDGTTADYNVIVTVTPNSAKAITAFSFVGYPGIIGTINEVAVPKTIAVTVPFGTDVTGMTALYTTTGTGVKVGAATQISGATSNSFTTPRTYTVTAADGTTANYNVTVTVTPNSAKAITAFSFVGYPGIIGTINEVAAPKTIAVTVPFGTDVTGMTALYTTTGTGVKVGAAVQTSGATPTNNFTNTVTYTVTADNGTTADYNVIVTVTPNSAKAITAFSFVGYPGITGTINEAATPKTIAVTVPFGTDVTGMTALYTTTGTGVKVGATVQTSGATPTNNFTNTVIYTVTAANGTTANYNVTVTVTPNSAKAITAFSFVGYPGITGIINEAATPKTIAVTVPFGTDVTGMTALYTTTGTGVKVGATVQTSGATPTNNFTNTVIYTVTAADSTTANYNVTVTVTPNSAKAITAFSFVGYPGITGIINEAATPKTIAVSVPFGTDVTGMTALYTTTGTGVKVGAAVQTSGATPTNDFTNTVIYTVTAADSTTANYNVTVTVLLQNPTAPVLGETARFVILASQKITTTVGSLITNGDLGIKDQARTYYEGFTTGANPGQFNELINGLSYAHDDIAPSLIPSPYASTIAFLDQVRTDLGIAYTFLANDPNPGAATQVCPTELGTRTLTRGVYKTASNVTIQTGTLTLDAQNEPNSVWVFTIGGTLTTGAPGGSIVLANGAQAKNVFWRTAGTTVLGAGTAFYGNVFAWQQVNLLAGASITGRLFSVNEQVTLISNPVTKAP